MIKLKGGIIYDPANNIDGKVADLWINDGKIVSAPQSQKKVKEYDVSGKIIMPGAIDIHTHIGGGKVNIARCMMSRHHDHNIMLGSIETGLRYAEMGYTSCFEPAMLPANARQAHFEMADTPIVDVGGYALLGNDDFFLQLLAHKASKEEIRNYVGWTLDASQAIAIKVVNPGGINAFKFNQRSLDIDEKSHHYRITPRSVIQALTTALTELGVPHPLHIHTSNLGVPGNYVSTLETIKAAEGKPIHLTHIQFHSYGNEGDHRFSSAAQEIAEAINANKNVTVDIGQIMFGQTVTISGDSPKQYANHKLASPKKWLIMDIECDAGCGIVPFKYRDKDFVNALQWTIGLEIFLAIKDPWRVFLTTDHPNGGPFYSYPHLIKILMDKNYRNDILSQINPQAQKISMLGQMTREYSLREIAIMTRAAPARSLGLVDKGHLSNNACADIVVYSPDKDPEYMFSKPLYVFKNGELVVDNGRIVSLPRGNTHVVKPEYDKDIEKKLLVYFEKYRTTNFHNIRISDDEMAESIGSSVITQKCQFR